MARTFQFQVSGKRLLVGLLLTFLPVSLLALYASTKVGRESEAAVGERLQTVAAATASTIQDRVRAKVVEAALIASDSAVLTAVRNSNQRYGRANDAEIQAQLEEQDAIWNTPRGQVLAEQMLAGSASQALRRLLTLDPDFLRITVTDRHGGTVAASHKTLDYYQADEQYWKNIFVTGRGAVSLTDVLYDDATQHQYIGVGVPVLNENNILIGTLDALVDIASLFPLVTQANLGKVWLSSRQMDLSSRVQGAFLSQTERNPSTSAQFRTRQVVLPAYHRATSRLAFPMAAIVSSPLETPDLAWSFAISAGRSSPRKTLQKFSDHIRYPKR